MKKFLIICSSIFLILLLLNEKLIVKVGLSVQELIYGKDSITSDIKIDGKDILIRKDQGYEKFEIVGMNINGSKPGAFPNENLVEKDEYLRWFKQIAEMNINCLRVNNLMSESFYEALKDFNENNNNPLYLLQGIYFDEVALKDGYDLQDKKVKENFIDHIKLVINAVHGVSYKEVPKDTSQIYKHDVSKYVIGYSLGVEWASKDIIYSNIMNKKTYNGKYFYADEDASAFEAYLAELADYTISYEKKRFGKQKLITFIGNLENVLKNNNSELDGEINSENDVTNNIADLNGGAEAAVPEIKPYIDLENIKATDMLKTGIFASYNVYPDSNILEKYKDNIGERLKELNQYHTIPVVISEYGIPSARLGATFIDSQDKGYITEEEQGNRIVQFHKEIKSAGINGSFLLEWQDSWYKSAWNTKDNKVLDNSPYWSDVQNYSQSFGLMAFDSGEEKGYEWNAKDVVGKNEISQLSVRSDEGYLYVKIDIDDKYKIANNQVYIDLDITPKSGTTKSSQFGLEFDRPSDFLIKISGENSSEILVQKYYSTYDLLEDIPRLRLRPNTLNVTKDMDEFVPIKNYIKDRIYIEEEDRFIEKEGYETGKLLFGVINHKNKEEYNSVADFYYNESYLEVRIPWALLNFMDPSKGKIQDDFNESFKIEPLKIEKIALGLTVKDHKGNIISRLPAVDYKLNEWIIPEYNERLKDSYYICKDYFNSIKEN